MAAREPMLWVTAAPFFHAGTVPDWVPAYVDDPAHRFAYVGARYQHDRSRASTSGRQWLDYLGHALQSWFSVAPWRRNVGYLSAFPQLPVMLGLLKRLCGSRRPLVAWMFNLGQTYGGMKGRLARFSLRAVDVFVVHSRAEIDSYSRWLGLPRERFVFVPLSIRMIEPSEAEDREQPYVFAMGSAHRDYRLLFAVMRELGHKTVVVAGPHATQGLQVPDNVTVLSGLSLQDCHRLCQRARVNVVPVDNAVTASGQVTLLETLMYGKAVVATQCVGIDDYVEPGTTALTVPAGDAAALRAGIETLWQDAALRERLGAAARRYIRDQVSFAGVARAMHDILSQASASGRR